jgi:hypothetical protein
LGLSVYLSLVRPFFNVLLELIKCAKSRECEKLKKCLPFANKSNLKILDENVIFFLQGARVLGEKAF